MTDLDFEVELTPAEAVEAARTEAFLVRIKEGVGPLNAAIEVGWTPAQLEKRMKDPEFTQLVTVSRERLLEDIEQTLVVKARAGNMRAIQMVLYNRRSDRWRDVRHLKVENTGQVDPTIVHSVAAAMREVLRGGPEAIAALQPPPEAIEVAARDVD